MAEQAVVNASPLIFLGHAGRLDLLREVVGPCLVPEPVRQELLRRGPEDGAVRAITSRPWLMPMAVTVLPDAIAAWGLGPGESSVLALAAADGNRVAIIDDLAARRCAASLAIPVRGTLGIVLIAKKRGLIPLARPVMAELMAHGMYLSRKVLDQAMARVGE